MSEKNSTNSGGNRLRSNLVAPAGCFIDSFASVVTSGYPANQALFIVFVAVHALVAEYSLAFWLLIKGGKGERPEKPAPKAA